MHGRRLRCDDNIHAITDLDVVAAPFADVKPGLRGLAQVKGRQLLDWDERFKLDVW